MNLNKNQELESQYKVKNLPSMYKAMGSTPVLGWGQEDLPILLACWPKHVIPRLGKLSLDVSLRNIVSSRLTKTHSKTLSQNVNTV